MREVDIAAMVVKPVMPAKMRDKRRRDTARIVKRRLAFMRRFDTNYHYPENDRWDEFWFLRYPGSKRRVFHNDYLSQPHRMEYHYPYRHDYNDGYHAIYNRHKKTINRKCMAEGEDLDWADHDPPSSCDTEYNEIWAECWHAYQCYKKEYEDA
jgi:hypothetical protein